MKKKIVFLTIILCALMGLTASASTSAAIMQQSWDEIMRNSFGDNYIAPYVVSGDEYVSLSDGSFDITETDLILPGKNGLNLEIRRKYTSNLHMGYKVNLYEDTSLGRYPTAQYYDATNNKYVEVLFATQEEMLKLAKDSFYAKTDYLNYDLREYTDVSRTFRINQIYGSANTGILLTRVTTSAPYITYMTVYHALSPTSLGDSEYTLGGSGWVLDLPELYWDFGDEIRGYGYFKTIDGSVYNLNCVFDTEYLSSVPTSISIQSSGNSGNGYTFQTTINIENFYPTETTEYGISYYIKVYDVAKKLTYYFGQWGRITGIADNYGNSIIFSESTTGNWTITDTMGRVVTVTSKPYNVSYTNIDGTIVNVISTEWTVEYNPDDPQNHFYADDNYTYTITDAIGNETVYNYSRTDMVFSSSKGYTWWEFASPYPVTFLKPESKFRLDTIEHPTGAATHYEYKRILKYFSHYYEKNMQSQDRLIRRYEKMGDQITGEYTYAYVNPCDDYISTTTKPYTGTKTRVLDGATVKNTYNYTSKGLSGLRSTEYINDGTVLRKEEYQYGCTPPLITKITTTDYGVSTSVSIEEFAYDAYRNITSHSKYASGETPHPTTYTYGTASENPHRYPLGITHQKDESTTVVQTNTLTEDKKNIASTIITENSVIKSRTDYTYNSIGELTSATNWIKDTNADGTLDSSDEKVTVNYNHIYNTDGTYQLYQYVEDVKNANGTAISLTNPIDDTTNKFGTLYGYDANGNIVSMRTPGGNVTTIAYDALRRPVLQTLPDNSTLRVEYNDSQNYIITTDELGNKQKYTFDPTGRQTAHSALIGGAWTTLTEYGYDAANRLTSQTAYRTATDKVITNYTYDTLDRLLSEYILNETGTSYSYTVPESNQTAITATPMYMTSAFSRKTEYKDPLGRTVKLTESNAAGTETHTTLYTYDYVGNVITEQTPRHTSANKFYTYDYAGNLLTYVDALNNITTYAYDMLGRNISVTNPKNVAVTTEYDILGRKIKDTNEMLLTTKYFYDNDGNLTKSEETDYPNSTYTYTYDNCGRMLTSTHGNVTTAYTYDPAGNMLTSATGGKIDVYTYDELGRNLSVFDPLGNTESYTYDLAGNMTGKTDRNGNVFTYQYNSLGLMINLSTTGLSYSYTYDKMGRKTGINNTNLYTYDDFSNIISAPELTYTYDAEGNRTKMVYSGKTVDYIYDTVGRLSNVKLNGQQYASYTYDSVGNPLTKTTAAGTTSYTYDDANDIVEKSTVKGTNSIFSGAYQRYSNGYVVSDGETVNGDYRYKGFDYDVADRMYFDCGGEYGNGDWFVNLHSFDNRGNIIKVVQENDWTSYPGYQYLYHNQYYTYDDNNRLIGESSDVTGSGLVDETISTGDTFAYTYDNNGNMLTKSQVTTDENDVQTTTLLESYEYDKLNRLVRINNHQTNYYRIFEYDLEGRLILMREYLDEGYGEDNGFYMEEHYVWDGDNLLSTYYMDHLDMDSYRESLIVRGIDLIADVALYAYASENSDTRYYVQNGHGDVVAITDENGNVLNTYEYDSYGNVISADETYHNSLRYCGEIQGIYGDLVYLRNRIYDPEIKRFLTEDPIMDGSNWYVYCNNNPINFWDPSGLELRLTGTGNQVQAIWQELKQLSHDDLVLTQLTDESGNLVDSYRVTIANENKGKYPAGTELIRRLVSDEERVTVQMYYGKDGNNYNAIHNTVYFNPDFDPDIPTESINNTVSLQKRPSYIGLAHEFIHTDRDLRGVMIPKRTERENSFMIYKNGKKTYMTESAPIEEYETIGIAFYDERDITENMIRVEHDLRERKAYENYNK